MTSFAFYRFSTRILSRSRGENVVARAAYQSGTEISCFDDKFGEHRFNFTAKENVSSAFIMAPEYSPEWVYDRQELWNTVLGIETRKDARLARDIMLSIPKELGEKEQERLVRNFVQHTLVNRYGMICDVAIHVGNDGNPHAHILSPLRRYNGDGWGKRDKDLVSKDILFSLRAAWAKECNATFAGSGLDLFVSERPKSAWKRELKLYLERNLKIEPSLSDEIRF